MSSSEIFPLVTPHVNNPVGVRIARAINDVRAHPFYFAHPDVSSLVAFKAGGRSTGDQVVLKDTIDSDDPVVAEFYLLAKIHEYDHFLTPDGNDVLKRDDTAPPNTRLRVALVRPTHSFCSDVDSDWTKMMANVGALAKKMLRKGIPSRLPVTRDGGGLVCSHKIMMLSDSESVEEAEEAVANQDGTDPTVDAASSEDEVDAEIDGKELDGFDKLFTIKGWPASERWHALAARFENTHSAVPLPAYDEKDSLIHPDSYERKLPGATVRAKVSFASYCIGGKTNVLVSEIQDLRIVIPATRVSSQGMKRRIAVLDHLVKRRKIDDK